MSGKKKIFLFTDWFEPGYKAGGPIRSCVNFARHMSDSYELYVFTSDRDLNSDRPYAQIKIDEWYRPDGKINLYYSSPAGLTWQNIRRQLQSVQADFIYLNSMFSTKFAIFPLLITRLHRINGKIILSPRGMLRSSAVEFKSFKKKIFFHCFRLLGFHRRVNFLASDETEVKDTLRYFGEKTLVTLIPNYPAALGDQPVVAGKKKGELSLIYIGRVHPIKNTDYLLRVLGEVRADIRLTIVGSLEDKEFWSACQDIIGQLPANISVDYAGEMPNHELPAITSRHHIFALPTRGENFGHAIFEALTLGKPVLISDQTPWRNLVEAKAGWDLALDQPELFRQAIEQAAAFDQEEYTARCLSAWAYIQHYLAQLHLKDEYVKLFS
jgi:glycosyltransferase involved in cell wall biosynthesis